MRIVAIINQKGGCGKTTTAVNLAGIMALRGLRTLLVDLDPQSHCAAGLAIPEQRIDLDIGDAMLAGPDDALDSARLLWRAARNLDLIPSRMKLAGLEAARGGLADRPDRDKRLAGVLARWAPNYDVCFVDCSPAIGLLTFNALAAATDILIPVETSFFALQGATKQVNTIRTLARRLGNAAPYWLVATLHDESSVLARDLLEELRRRFGKRVAPCVIRRDPALKEAASFGQPVIEYAPDSHGAADYTALAQWLIEVLPLAASAGAGKPAVSPGTAPVSRAGVHSDQTDPHPSVSRSAVEPEPGEEAEVETHPSSVDVAGIEAFASLGVKADLPRPAPVPETPSPRQEVPASATMRAGQATPAKAGVSAATCPAGASGTAESARAANVAHLARSLMLRRIDERLRALAGDADERTLPSHPTLQRVVLDRQAGSLPRPSLNLRHLYGVRCTRSGVLFVQPIAIGASVAVAGDFTGWRPVAMRRNEGLGVFELCLPISPGTHQYRLVIDSRWSADPFNECTTPNPYGELNSVVVVEESDRLSGAARPGDAPAIPPTSG